MKCKNLQIRSNCLSDRNSGDRVVVIERSRYSSYIVIDVTSSSDNPSLVAQQAQILIEEILNSLNDCSVSTLEKAFLLWHQQLAKLEGVNKLCFAGILKDETITLAFNVGDARVYGISDDLYQITRDDSLVSELIESGRLSEEKALFHEDRSSVSQVIGGETPPVINFYNCLEEYCKFLISSDGIHGEFLTKHLSHIHHEAASDIEFAENLYKYSKSETNFDDRSLIIIEL